MNSIETIGYLAGAIVAVSLAPQLIKSWKTKSTKDISITWTSIYLIGLILWIVYGLGIASRPLVITVTVEALMTFSLLVMKLIYK